MLNESLMAIAELFCPWAIKSKISTSRSVNSANSLDGPFLVDAWRSFALPRLQTRYGVLTACVLLSIPESLLHLPYFWNKDVAFYQTVGMFWFTAFNLALVFIYAFMFNKTKGSLLIVTIAHASQNAWANLLSDNTLRPFQFTVALVWMIAIALIFITKGQLGFEPEK